MLTARTLVLGKIETSYNTDPTPDPATDAYLVYDADIKINPNVLERKNYRPSLSPTQVGIGRKLVTVTFKHEVKGGGTVGTAPRLGPMLRACGMAETTVANTAAAVIQAVVNKTGNTVNPTWGKTTVATSRFGRYTITCTTGGASATAKVRVSGVPMYEGDDTLIVSEEYSVFANNSAAGTVTIDKSSLEAPTVTFGGTWVAGEKVTLTIGGVRFTLTVGATATPTGVGDLLAAALVADGRFDSSANDAGVVTVAFTTASTTITTAVTGVDLGQSGGVITPTWSGNLTAGDSWTVDLLRPGVHYTPVSTGFESVTIYMYFDGLLHKVTGCMGTVAFSGTAGAFAEAAFTFTGQYIAAADVALPTDAVFEATDPEQVELAALVLGDYLDACAQQFSMDINNTVSARDCINGSDGFDGVQITGRTPQGGVNPETVLEATHPFWDEYSQAKTFQFHVKVGTATGNIVHFESHTAQHSSMGYADRNGTRTYDISLRFSAETANGDDEIRVCFS